MSHVSDEQLAAYWLDEIDQSAADALEEHVFACDACAAAWTRTRSVISELRELLPPVISSARLAELQAKVAVLPQAVVAPGGQATVRFGGDNQHFLLRLQAELQYVERVDCRIEAPGGATLMEQPAVPFDREAGAVLLVCQRHFVGGGYPTRIHVHLRAIEAGGQPVELGVYTLDHEVSL
jgi:hypothetical protein